MGAGKYDKKHGVAIIVNKRWKHRINWTKFISERATAASVIINKQPITLLSVYMPHSGYADHHVQKAYDMIQNVIRSDRSMQIIGGDFNAELGPGIGIEQTSAGQYTLKEANSRGEKMKQWLMAQKMVALNTMYKNTFSQSKPRTDPKQEYRNRWTTFW